MFEKSKVYNFTVRGLTVCNGMKFFLLSHGGKNTMPEYYQQYQWEFRVPMLPFQEDWEREKYEGKEMECLVTGFNSDLSGRETPFPKLVQAREPLLRKNYVPGNVYPFIVEKNADTTDSSAAPNESRVRDALGFKHKVRASHPEWHEGQQVNLRVVDISGPHLKFEEDGERIDRTTLFSIGESYEFTIETEEFDSAQNMHFFNLRDTTEHHLLHRFYFKEDRQEGPGDKITLQLKGFTRSGYLFLADCASLDQIPAMADVEQAEKGYLGGEDQHLEYKSSFVYTAKGVPDIDNQLDKEIMQQLAGFMNADGGTVCIGYRDDGTVRGIEEDLKYINSSNEDEYNDYKLTQDGIKLKFINTIKRKLGKYACTHVTPQLLQKDKFLVCHLHVSPAARLVFWENEFLFVRCHNSLQTLRGNDLVNYALERYKFNQAPPADAPATNPAPPATQTENSPGLDRELKRIAAKQGADVENKTWRYISLYGDGTVSSQPKAADGEDVFLNIAVGDAYKKKSSRLLLCYNNGCVNVLNPAAVVSDKLTKAKRRYANGYNRDNSCKLIAALICDKDDYLVIRSTDSHGKCFIKAVELKDYKVHSPQSMSTQGNKFVDLEYGTPERYQIVQASMQSVIYPILSKPRRYGAGFSMDAQYCREIVDILDKR